MKAFKRLGLLGVSVALCAIATPQVAGAASASCALDPTKGGGGMAATSRFGTWRSYYNGGKGGGHGGQDLRAAVGMQLYSPFNGTVAYKSVQPNGAGNFLAIRNDNGDIVWFMHLSGYANGIAVGTKVTAGQFVALSGNTGRSSGPHLHLEYTVKRQEDARNNWVTKGMSREQVFQAQNHLSKKSDGTYTTDPAGYLCETYTFVGDATKDNAVLGKDTKAQYEILYGSVPNGTPPNAEYTDTQTIAANSVAVQANAQGKTVTQFLSDRDGFGALPGMRYEKYENVSPSEMLARESKRRMIDAEWQKNLTQVSSRALWVDYLQTVAVSNYMQEAIYRKKEKVEGLLATLVAQEAATQRAVVDAARSRAVRQSAAHSLN
jgi:murein DD-endopeptidase